MARIDFEGIKRRHANFGFVASGISEGGDDPIGPIYQQHEDLGALITEHERFTSNFILALDYIDSFMLTHANVLPDDTAENMRTLQARMRGLM